MKLRGNIKDYLFEKTTALFALGVLTLTLLLFGLLVRESLPAIRKIGASFATNTTWDPVLEEFGALPFLYGTVVSSFLAILIALPLGVGAAIFINEFAPEWLKTPISFLAELLAAIPSVIYGLWGIFVLVPILRDYFMKPASRVLGWIPLFQGPVYGPSMLAAGVLLSIMILPFILSVSREVLATVPRVQKEAVLSLGGTHWEMIRIVIGQHCIPGIFGATILGLGRALGETMAVTMVIGNRPDIVLSLFQPGYSMAAVIANEFTEATGDLYLSALVEIGLVLFLLTIVVNFAAKLILKRFTPAESKRTGR
ncbi:MAG TPA: phosphate ABC transporter permease subunit PstC [Candidatus Deferrimicrobiaceae bacterium]|jgi:phosphate transport system permease protein|nr:phosphate ABC transporter permease subunit PstC [Candidatus Deferrimicrobiaceae bacterium]